MKLYDLVIVTGKEQSSIVPIGSIGQLISPKHNIIQFRDLNNLNYLDDYNLISTFNDINKSKLLFNKKNVANTWACFARDITLLSSMY